jgi:hypothetical protein
MILTTTTIDISFPMDPLTSYFIFPISYSKKKSKKQNIGITLLRWLCLAFNKKEHGFVWNYKNLTYTSVPIDFSGAVDKTK